MGTAMAALAFETAYFFGLTGDDLLGGLVSLVACTVLFNGSLNLHRRALIRPPGIVCRPFANLQLHLFGGDYAGLSFREIA